MMLLALRRPLLNQLHGVQLRPVHLRPGKSPLCTLDADGPLDDFKSWAGFYKPPYQTEVAARQGITRPHPDYEILHGMFGRLVKLDQLLQLVAQGHWVFGPSILRPEQLFCRDLLLSSVKIRGIQYTAGKICKRSWRAPNSGKKKESFHHMFALHNHYKKSVNP